MKWESAWFLCVEKANVFYSDIINGCENEIDVYICVLKNRTLTLLLTSVGTCVISISWILIALWILFTLIRLGQTFWQQSTSDSSYSSKKKGKYYWGWKRHRGFFGQWVGKVWQELKWWRPSWSWGIFFFKVLFLGHSVMLGTFQIIVVTQLTAVWSIFDIAYALRLAHLSALRGWRTLTLPTRDSSLNFTWARSLWLPMFFLLLFYQDPSPLTSWTGTRNPASSIWAEKSSEHIRISMITFMVMRAVAFILTISLFLDEDRMGWRNWRNLWTNQAKWLAM